MQYLDFSRFNFFNAAKTADTQTPVVAPDAEQIAIEGELQKSLERSAFWGEKHLQGEADEQALIEQKSWLRHLPWNEKPCEMDFHFFALLSGDAFINGTPLEGYTYDKSMEHYINFFEMLLRQKNQPEVKELVPYFPKIQSYLEQLKACKNISQKIHQLMQRGTAANEQARNQMIKDYAEELSQEFAKGGMEWFPGGWIDTSSGGHAMLLKFEKDGSIAFVNSGGGLEYHASADLTGPDSDGTSRTIKHKAQGFLKLKGNNNERLGSVDFFRFLLEVNVWPAWDGSFRPDAKIIYEGLFDYLGGRKESAYDPNRNPLMYKIPQRAGSCAAKSISTGLYYHLIGIFGGKESNPEQAVKIYKKTKFLWERQALLAQCNQLLPPKDQLQGPQLKTFAPETERLLEDVMKNMGREAESLFDDKLLTSDDMQALHATFLDIRDRIRAVKERQDKLLSGEMRCERDYRVRDVPYFATHISPHSVNRPIAQDDSDSETEASQFSKTIMNLKVGPLVDPKNASQTLNSWLKVLEPILTQKDIRSELRYGGQKKDLAKVILNYFEDLFVQIPMPERKKEHSFWERIPQNQVLECMRSVKAMMTMLNLASHAHSEERSALTVTANFAFLAIMDQLARRLPESKLKNQQINYFELLQKIKSPYFINSNPQVQAQLSKVLKYFNPKLTIDNACHFEDSFLKEQRQSSLFNYTDKYGRGPRLEIDKDKLKTNPTLIYFRQFLKWDDPAVRNKLMARGVSPALSLIEQLQGMLWVDRKQQVKHESVLPECVELLQQAALHCTITCNQKELSNYSILRYSSDINSLDSLPNFEFDEGSCYVQGGFDYIHWWESNSGYKSGFLQSPLTSKTKESEEDSTLERPKRSLYAKSDSAEKKEKDDKTNTQLEALLNNEYERITQNSIIHKGDRYFDLNGEDSHELAMLGVDPYDEVNRTIAFARRHVALLNKTHLQDLIYVHLLKHGRMFSQLSDSEKYADEMIVFLEEAIDYYIKACDPKTCLYLAKIGHTMKDFVKKSGCALRKPFPNFHALILDRMVPMMKDPGQIKQACEMIVKWHLPSKDDGRTDPETLSKLAEAIILTSLSARLETRRISDNSDLGLDLVTRNTQQFWMPVIREIMQKDRVVRDRILNRVFGLLIEGVQITKWEGEFPNFRSGHYEINVLIGTAKVHDDVVVTLPDTIVRHDAFKKLKIKTISHVTQPHPGQYIIYPDEIYINDSRPDIEIRKRMDGNIYRYRSEMQELINGYPTLFDANTHFWTSEFAHGEPHCLAIREGCETIKLRLRSRYYQNDSYSVVSIEQGDREWIPLTNHSLKKVLTPIESNLKYIDCWRKKNSPYILDSVTLSRLGLTLFMREEGDQILAYCHEFPGFFISESRFVNHSLDENDPYIVLENAAGQKKVIFPKINLKSLFEKQQDTTLSRKILKTIPEKPSKQWMEFSLKEGQLHSSFVGPRLYLTLFYVSKGNFAQAHQLIRGINSTAAFTNKDKEILRSILSNLSEDKHPAARALLLHLFAMTEENKLKFPPSVGTKDEALVDILQLFTAYQDYLQSVGNIPTFKLSEEQEKFVLLFAKKHVELMLKKNPFEIGAREALVYIKEQLEDFNSRSSVMGYSSSKIPKKKETHSSYRSSYWLQTAVEAYVPPLDSPRFLYEPMLMKDSSKLKNEFAPFYDVALRGSVAEKKKLVAFLDLQKGNIKETEDMERCELLKKACRFPSCYPKIAALKAALAKKSAAKDEYKASKECERTFDSVVSNKSAWIVSKIAGIIPGIFSLLFKAFSALFTIPSIKWRQRWKSIDEKKISSTLLLLDGKPLQQIDQSFNRYFKKVTDKYFACEEQPVEPIAPHLPVDHPDPLVEKKLKQENADLDAFNKMRPKVRRTYSIRPGADLKNLEAVLEQEVRRWKGVLKAQKQALIWQANRIAQGRDPHKRLAIHKDAALESVTWEDLLDSFCKGTLQSFQKKTQLNEDEINGLFQGVADYALKKNRYEQMKHVIKAYKDYEKSAAEVRKEEGASLSYPSIWELGPLRNSPRGIAHGAVREKEQKEKSYRLEEAQAKKALYLQHIVTALSLLPAYELKTENRSEMLFEMANRYFIRKEQIEKHAEMLDNLKLHPEQLAQMRTGYGKTKTMIPRGDIDLAALGNLVVNLWPESIEDTNTQDVKTQLENSYARPVDAMRFDRSTELTEQNLEKRYKELLKDIKEGRPLNIRPETIRALEAHLILMLNDCHHKQVDASGYEKQLEYLLKIHHLIRVSTVAFIDEGKHNLTPGEDLIYTLGRPQGLPKNEVDLIEEMHDILSKPPYKDLLDVANNNHPLLSRKDFDDKIALDLIKIYEEKWGIEDERKAEFRQYILGDKNDAPDWMQKHPQFSQIALLRGNLLFIMPVATKGYVDQQFGLSKKHIATKEFAVPYISANTPKETERAPSECKNPHEALNKTYLTYLHKGLSKKQTVKLIELLRELAFKETGVGVTFDQTPTAQLFKQICPQARKPLNMLTAEDIEGVYEGLRHNKLAIFYYIRNIVVPQIVYYPKTIASSTQNLRSQFSRSISLTATPQDTGAHGPDTFFLPVKGTAGQVTHVLYTKCREPQTIQALHAVISRDLLKQTQAIAEKDPSIRATVDVGALYKGIPNRELAEKHCESLKKLQTDIEGVVFFDAESKPQRFMVMNVADGHEQTLEACSLDPSKRYTIYDQHRTYGSDIPQAFSAKALILLSKETTKSEAAQGWGRLRQGDKILDGQIKGQSPIFALPAHMSKEVFGQKDPNISDLLVHLVANEALDSAEFNYEALKEQMDNEIRRALLDKIQGVKIGTASEGLKTDPSTITVDVKQALRLFSYFEKELIKEENFDPVRLYSATPKSEETVGFLKSHQARCIEKVKKCRGLTSKEKKYIIDRLERYSAKWSGKEDSLALPKEVKATSSALGLSCEVFNEVETEVNVNHQIEVQGTDILRMPAKWNDSLDLFKAGWEKPSSMRFTFLTKLVSKVTEVARRAFVSLVLFLNDGAVKNVTIGVAVVSMWVGIELLLIGLFTLSSKVAAAALPFLMPAGMLAMLSNHEEILKSKLWKWLNTSTCKNYRLKEVLREHLPGKVSKALQLFSPNFLSSDNFYRQNTYGLLEPIQTVFDREQKPLFEVLVIQDEVRGKKQLQFMAIDQNDSQYFRKRLQQDAKADTLLASQRTRKIAVVDVRSGKIVAEGKNGFDNHELIQNPDYHSLMGQAKLLEGEVLYTEDEQELLKASVNKIGKDVIRQLFENYILPLHPLNKHCYTNKPIAQILGRVVA